MSNTSINETYIIEGIGEVLEFSACTAIFTNALKSCSGNTTISLGENLIVFDGNTLATIISATTFYGDGSNLTGISTQDTFVTGGTYSNGTAVFTNNTGGTFSVTGFSVSNATQFTGGTVTGSTFFSDGLSATTISATTYLGLPITTDIFVTGGTYNDGTAVFTNNSGDTFDVTGFTTPFTGGTVTGPTIFTDGLTATTISATTYLGLPITSDIYVTGGTYSDGTAEFTNNSGDTFNVTGFTTPFTGGTVTGTTIFTDGLTANTFALSTTPTTNTTDTDVLLRNQLTGVVEQRSINSLINVVNLVTVGLSGSTGVDYNSIKEAVDSIVDASATNTYVVKVGPGVFYEDPITMKSYVDVIGESETNTIIQANNPNTSLIIGADQSMVSEVQIQGCTGTGVAAVVYSSPTTPQLNAIFYVENVRFGANYTHAKTVGTSGGNCIMQCSNVKYGGYPFTLGFYVTNDGSGIGRMQLRNVTSTNGGVTTTSGLVFAKADQPSCAFIVNGCLLTKASGAAAGTGFWIENGGSLRLTGVNFQRWETGIYVPQIGSAPSIDAIALNFENCTTDVNIIHSGATGKVQGTDNYLKTLININAPLYEVNQDPRVITVAKKGGDFSSIKAAVDSITGSSSNNRFLISVGPGKFSEGEIDLSQKPYISIKGSDLLVTEIVPNSNTQHIFKIGQNNEISFLSLSGAPSGYAGIYVYDTGIYSLAHKLSFIDCDTNVWVESHTQYTSFYGEYLDFNGEYSYGTKTIAYNGYVALTNMENYYNFPTGTGTTIANHVQGSGATLSVFVGDGIGNGASGSTNYQISDYASLNTMSTTCYNWGYAVRVLNNGGPSRFDIDSLSIVDSLVWDLSIEHPNTFGTFGGGSSSHAKINNLSNDVYWAFLDIEDGEFDITRKISITFQDNTHTDASTLIFEGSTMGLIDGGVITHISGLTFEVSSGFGYLKKTIGNGIYMRVDWPATQITLLPNNETYLYFNENEILSSSGSAPDVIANIILGRVVTDSSTVRFIDASPYIASHTSNLFSDFNRNALGPIYSTGSIVTENVTPYHLNISSGDYYYSENNFKPSGGTDVSFIQYYRDNLTGWTTTGTTEVVNGYDDNSGTISPLPLSSFTKHSLYVVGEGVNETYMLVLGQTTYSTLVEAEGADLPTPPNYFDDSVAPIASILIQQGMSGITEIQDIRPVIGFKAAGVSASAVHANLLGLSSDDHTQYLLVDGGRAMSGNLSMGGNAIFSALTVNGVTVESHASRHKNGGADEISSATPAPSEIPKADTFGKLDGWISDASTTVKGLTRLSVNPLSASVPIAVGVNDSRFLNSISGGTYSSGTTILNNNTGGTISITGYTYIPHLEYNNSNSTLWNNGFGNVSTNISFGQNALVSNTSGTYNTAIGGESLSATTTGNYNTGIGGGSLTNNTIGVQNFGIGSFALYYNTTGSYNTAIGTAALQDNTVAERNVAIGGFSLYRNTGSRNIAIGFYAGSATKGSDNILLGANASSITDGVVSGSNNTIIGTLLSGVVNGSNNTIFGKPTGLSSTTTNNIVIADGSGNIRFRDDNINTILPRLAGSGDRMVIAGSNGELSARTITDTTFTGGTVNGPTIFTNGLTANTFSLIDPTTTFNIVGNIFGQTYLQCTTGALILNPGYGGVNINGGNANLKVDGTITSDSLIGTGTKMVVASSSGLLSTQDISTFTGGTVSGATNFTGGLTATTISAGTISTSLTSGSVLFSNGSTIAQDNANLFWDDTNNRLGIGTNAPTSTLTVNGTTRLNGGLTANTISATTYQNLPLGSVSTSGSTLYSTSPSTSNFNTTNSIFLGSNAGLGATSASNSNFLGQQAGSGATDVYQSNFLGQGAGYGATGANNSNFLGYQAGNNAYDAFSSNFFGAYAGYGATNSGLSNFFGYQAGQNATDAGSSNFLGGYAGFAASSASYSNFFGYEAGYNATYANDSNFMGQGAGYGATSADNSNFFGLNAGNGAANASYSTLIGYKVGSVLLSSNSIGSNNIIIGTNITLPSGTTNSLNLGGVLFGSNTYSDITGNPSLSAQTNGRIGINIITPSEALHVSGNTRIQGDLSATTISATTYLNLPSSGSAFTGGTVSGATTFTGGLTANTISATTITATTYLNLPNTTFTGGTVSGETTFSGGLSATTISATTITSPSISTYGLIVATSMGYQNIF